MSTTFQSVLKNLAHFWEKQGCALHQGYDLEVGAGTFNPTTFLRCLGPEPYSAAYIEPSRRPADGRYGDNPVRMQHYFQFQVILKPSPPNVQELCLESLTAIGIDLKKHDVRFVHDDWESPTLGAWGLGWEVWLDGMEVLQFTYFQSCGGVSLSPITAEITYGTERLTRYLQQVESSFDMQWNDTLSYGDIYHRNEIEWSQYNFEHASTEMWFRHFQDYEQESKRLISLNLPLPAYDFVLKASHAFNLLEARRFFSVTERAGYIARIRDLAREVAEAYLRSREEQGYPLLRHLKKENSVSIPTFSAKIPNQNTADFLLEIGSEELPASFVPLGMASLEKNARQLLEKERISFSELSVYGAPRRLALLVNGLATKRAPEMQEKKGPLLSQAYANEELTRAGEGFFRALNRKAPSYAELIEGKVEGIELRAAKGETQLVATWQTAERLTAEILMEELPKLISNLDFPKKMRWGTGEIAYARPLRWLVALLGDEVVPFSFAGLTANRHSQGHRQRQPGAFPIQTAQDYVSTLRKHQVLVDVEERKQAIEKQLQELEKQLGGVALARAQVIPQVLHLVECPTLTYGTFDAAFLKVPQEVLISEMVEHQKYFPLAEPDGQLKNQFVITADTSPTSEIRQGNEKVLSARLFDGSFLYAQDLKTALEAFNEKLKQVTYLKGMGSVFEKAERLIAHVETLHERLPLGSLQEAKRAALLCKADLASGMVGEFPELQGTIGRIYAKTQGESEAVAQAIEEHWMPRGEGAPLPASPAGILLSLAERFDNLLSCFIASLQPTSSSDPYGLRRQMLAIVRILIRERCHMDLPRVLSACYDHFPARYENRKVEVLKEIEQFMTSRVKTVFLEYGFRKDEIEASLSQGVQDLFDTFCRIEALHAFRKSSPLFGPLFEVYKRAKGQIQGQPSKAFERDLLQAPEEKALAKALDQLESELQERIAKRSYFEAYQKMATLQPLLAQLFDHVKVLVDDPQLRANRIALLQRVFALFNQLLDFDKIHLD